VGDQSTPDTAHQQSSKKSQHASQQLRVWMSHAVAARPAG